MLAIVVGLIYGPSWDWDWSLQTGNIFILITIPDTLIAFSGVHIPFLILLVLGIAAFIVFARAPKAVAAKAANGRLGGIWAPRFRVYPVLLFFGLFLLYFGVTFLFKASVSGADGVSGLAAFVYLNYDGILNRGIISLFGAAILLAGLYTTLRLSWQPGLGFDVKPLSQIVAPAQPRSDDDQWIDEMRKPMPAPPPVARPVQQAAKPVPAAAPRRVTTASGTPRRAPSRGRPSSASPRVRSHASRAPPARTATTSTRPSTASSRAAAGKPLP